MDAAAEPAAPANGPLVELTVGPVAHGGHCVARHEGRVVFVRHALPGERVRAAVTDGGATARFWRADAVEVLQAAPERVAPPCPWAGPGRCGGCDWQHASLAAQRRLKGAVVAEALHRLGRQPVGGVVPDIVVVEAVEGDRDGLGWRTRMQWSVDATGRAGLRRHRSHEVVPVDRCRIAHPLVDGGGVTDRPWPPLGRVDAVASVAAGTAHLRAEGAAGGDTGGAGVLEVLGPHRWELSPATFWQVHPGASAALTAAVLQMLRPAAGEVALDLYGGAGLFAAVLADAVGERGAVWLVEASPSAVADARRALRGLLVRVVPGRVDRVLARPPRARGALPARADLVVLDPPRTGAGRAVLQRTLSRRPRAVAYVACDPAALGRDVATATGLGYRLVALRAFDLFPMTAHVECVALLVPS